MSQNLIGYIAFLWKPEKEDGDFGVTFPDFPGCVSHGKNEAEATENAKEALIFHMQGMIEDGDDIPSPSSLPKILEEEFGPAVFQRTLEETLNSNYMTAMIFVQKPTRQVRFNVLANAAELALIDKAAEEKGMPRSRFLIETALDEINRYN